MEHPTNSVIKTGEWIVILLITSIPIVNIVMLFVWAFGSDTNPNKANWAKATLIWIAIILVISFFFSVLFLGTTLSLLDF